MAKKMIIHVPECKPQRVGFRLRGTDANKLMINNGEDAAGDIDAIYWQVGGKTGSPKKEKATQEEAYLRKFYVLDDSPYPAPDPRGWYGVPIGGIQKAIGAAIAMTGVTGTNEISRCRKSFKISSPYDTRFCRIFFEEVTPDIRPVRVNRVPRLACRPIFTNWRVDLLVTINPQVMTVDGVYQYLRYAGVYVGLCEMRAEKGQGECGGFEPEVVDAKTLVKEAEEAKAALIES